jgi:hypothetical protein
MRLELKAGTSHYQFYSVKIDKLFTRGMVRFAAAPYRLHVHFTRALVVDRWVVAGRHFVQVELEKGRDLYIGLVNTMFQFQENRRVSKRCSVHM